MSYRIWCKNSKGEEWQIFGNNEYPEKFIELVAKYGEIDDEGCFYDVSISDINSIVDVFIEIIHEHEENFNKLPYEYRKEARSIYDFTNRRNSDPNITEYSNIDYMLDTCYMFMIYSFIKNIIDDIEIYNEWENDDLVERYRLKKGRTILFSGY